MALIAGTPQERRSLYLKLAAEAETTAAKLTDPTVKAAWIDSTVSWMMLASEISSEHEGGLKRLSCGEHYWRR